MNIPYKHGGLIKDNFIKAQRRCIGSDIYVNAILPCW